MLSVRATSRGAQELPRQPWNREKLAKQDPGNAGWQRDLSVSYDNVGDVQRAQGDLAGALKSYRDSLGIAEKLAKQDPSNAGWQRDLSVRYSNVGNVQAHRATSRVRSRATARALESPRSLPSRIRAMRTGSAISPSARQRRRRAGAQGDLAGTLKSYRESLGIAEKLAKQNPSNALWQCDLALVYWKTGSVWALVEPKSRNEARATVERGRDILRQMKEHMGLTAVHQEWLNSIEADLRKIQKKK